MNRLKIVFFISKKDFSASRSASYFIPELTKKNHEVMIFDRDDLNNRDLVFKALEQFNPDIMHFFWTRRWMSVLSQITRQFKSSKIIIDFRSPILLGAFKQKIRRTKFNEELNGKVHAFFSTTFSVIKNNLGVLPNNSFEYFVGVSQSVVASDANSKIRSSPKNLRLVVVSTLHPKRKLAHLMLYCTFANICLTRSVSLDIIGDGENIARLRLLSVLLRPFCDFRVLGAFEHHEMLGVIASYDAGITHLPLKVYSDAPALKTFEYFAAGIPVLATKNNYHVRLYNEGFHLSLYENSVFSFIKAIKSLPEPESNQTKLNQEKIKQYEWENLFKNIIEPAYLKIIQIKDPVTFSHVNRGWRDKFYWWCCQIFR